MQLKFLPIIFNRTDSNNIRNTLHENSIYSIIYSDINQDILHELTSGLYIYINKIFIVTCPTDLGRIFECLIELSHKLKDITNIRIFYIDSKKDIFPQFINILRERILSRNDKGNYKINKLIEILSEILSERLSDNIFKLTNGKVFKGLSMKYFIDNMIYESDNIQDFINDVSILGWSFYSKREICRLERIHYKKINIQIISPCEININLNKADPTRNDYIITSINTDIINTDQDNEDMNKLTKYLRNINDNRYTPSIKTIKYWHYLDSYQDTFDFFNDKTDIIILFKETANTNIDYETILNNIVRKDKIEHIYMYEDIFAIGTKRIMLYYMLLYRYLGQYKPWLNPRKSLSNDYYNINKRFYIDPKIQLTEHIMHFSDVVLTEITRLDLDSISLNLTSKVANKDKLLIITQTAIPRIFYESVNRNIEVISPEDYIDQENRDIIFWKCIINKDINKNRCMVFVEDTFYMETCESDFYKCMNKIIVIDTDNNITIHAQAQEKDNIINIDYYHFDEASEEKLLGDNKQEKNIDVLIILDSSETSDTEYMKAIKKLDTYAHEKLMRVSVYSKKEPEDNTQEYIDNMRKTFGLSYYGELPKNRTSSLINDTRILITRDNKLLQVGKRRSIITANIGKDVKITECGKYIRLFINKLPEMTTYNNTNILVDLLREYNI